MVVEVADEIGVRVCVNPNQIRNERGGGKGFRDGLISFLYFFSVEK